MILKHFFFAGNVNINPIFTPGHTKGCICYQIGLYLFTGDVLFNEGCGVCLGNGSSATEMYFSLDKLKKIIPENTIVYPGHSFASPVGQTFKVIINNNVYMNFDSLEQFVQFRMRKNQGKIFNFK